jgi:hypothetical protein
VWVSGWGSDDDHWGGGSGKSGKGSSGGGWSDVSFVAFSMHYIVVTDHVSHQLMFLHVLSKTNRTAGVLDPLPSPPRVALVTTVGVVQMATSSNPTTTG